MPLGVKSSLAGTLLAAFGAAACCVGPLLLVMTGIGGAWAASLRSLEPLQPAFAAITLGCLGWAFYRLYLQHEACAPGEACAAPQVRRNQRVLLWIVAIMAVAMLAFPLYAPIFY
ncbi:MAG: mercury transporter MerT [Betaproteobacteria bacterium]|nr:mercury transporter MerT [Betaproteobacteria bacterium]